jgi:selenium metabolism protein YedF
MATVVDCRGLACPQPVIRTKKAMTGTETLIVIVDDDSARENVSRMASNEGYTAKAEVKDDGIYVHLSKGEVRTIVENVAGPVAVGAAGPTVLLMASDSMGRGDEELGGVLIRSFLHTMNEVEPLPETLVFINAGVKLTVEGSPVLEDLQALERKGLTVLSCGTCLGHFGLKESVAVGEISNMYTIAETLLGAGKVVAL